MDYFSTSSRSTPSAFVKGWSHAVLEAVPVFLRLIPAYLLITCLMASLAVVVLLMVGKAAFHLFCMFSPLIFIVFGLARGSLDRGDRWMIGPAAWADVAFRFWRYAAPLAIGIGLTLNLLILMNLVLADIAAFRAGDLPNLLFHTKLFTAEKLPMLPMLLTTAIEQQMMFMPMFVIMGGRFEPHLVALVLSRSISRLDAKSIQEGLTRRQKLLLSPLRFLVILGVLLQFTARSIDATVNVGGTFLLLASYFGWLFYGCLLAVFSRKPPFFEPKKTRPKPGSFFPSLKGG